MRGAKYVPAAALLCLCCAVAASIPINLAVDPTAWRIVNDGVMGGVSTSRVSRAGDALRFAGDISLDNNGGFASVRRSFDAAARGGDAAGFALQVRGDGNRYRLRVYTRDAAGGEHWYAHYATFDTRAGEVTSVRLRWPQFAASFRGRAVDAPPIRFIDVIGIGVMITKDDHRDGRGPFTLELLSIEPLAR
jgi:NADH dehydrogenase [ubiquinone] 1 alpha subcomplex assembly factor 1